MRSATVPLVHDNDSRVMNDNFECLQLLLKILLFKRNEFWIIDISYYKWSSIGIVNYNIYTSTTDQKAVKKLYFILL